MSGLETLSFRNISHLERPQDSLISSSNIHQWWWWTSKLQCSPKPKQKKHVVVDMVVRDEKRNNGKWKPMKENSDIFPTYVC